MSESLADLLAIDAELDRIAAREGDSSRDLVLAELALLAAAVDDAPLPPVITPASRPAMTNAGKAGWALSVTIALMVTSSGVAAAVSDDPLAPLHYVTTQMWSLGPHTSGKLPGWELDGAMPISTVPGAGLPGAGAGTTGGAPGAGVPAAGDDGPGTPDAPEVPDARLAGHPGSTAGGPGGTGSGPGTGSSGRPPSFTSGFGRQGINSGTHPPRDGHGQPPDNAGGTGIGSSGSGQPGEPSRPTDPGRLPGGDRNGQVGHPGYGRVPGSGTGHCRVDRPELPGASSWSGPAETLQPCGSHPSPPRVPIAPSGPGLQTTPPSSPPSAPVPDRSAPTTRPAPKASEPPRSLP